MNGALAFILVFLILLVAGLYWPIALCGAILVAAVVEA